MFKSVIDSVVATGNYSKYKSDAIDIAEACTNAIEDAEEHACEYVNNANEKQINKLLTKDIMHVTMNQSILKSTSPTYLMFKN